MNDRNGMLDSISVVFCSCVLSHPLFLALIKPLRNSFVYLSPFYANYRKGNFHISYFWKVVHIVLSIDILGYAKPLM